MSTVIADVHPTQKAKINCSICCMPFDHEELLPVHEHCTAVCQKKTKQKKQQTTNKQTNKHILMFIQVTNFLSLRFATPAILCTCDLELMNISLWTARCALQKSPTSNTRPSSPDAPLRIDSWSSECICVSPSARWRMWFTVAEWIASACMRSPPPLRPAEHARDWCSAPRACIPRVRSANRATTAKFRVSLTRKCSWRSWRPATRRRSRAKRIRIWRSSSSGARKTLKSALAVVCLFNYLFNFMQSLGHFTCLFFHYTCTHILCEFFFVQIRHVTYTFRHVPPSQILTLMLSVLQLWM